MGPYHRDRTRRAYSRRFGVAIQHSSYDFLEILINTSCKVSEVTHLFPTFPSLFPLFLFDASYARHMTGCAVPSTHVHVPGSDIHLKVWTNEPAQPRSLPPEFLVVNVSNYRIVFLCLFVCCLFVLPFRDKAFEIK